MADRIVIFPGKSTAKLTKWKIKKGMRISKGTLLALYKYENSDNLEKLKCDDVDLAGNVLDKLVAEGAEIRPGCDLLKVEGCRHETVMKDMCAECGTDLRQLEREEKKNGEKSASVAMVHSIPELVVSEQQALEIGHEDEERLLRDRKLTLVVDLDQTVIHTTNDLIPANLKGVHHFQLWHGRGKLWYHTKFRPGMARFLEEMSKLFELHICSFGVRLYAHTIARFIDPDKKYFSQRILSRDECFDPTSKTANLKALFPCGDSMVCIIDDREDVWNSIPNLVHVKPYVFFEGTADINAPPTGGAQGDEEKNQNKYHRKKKIIKVPRKKHDQNTGETVPGSQPECVENVQEVLGSEANISGIQPESKDQPVDVEDDNVKETIDKTQEVSKEKQTSSVVELDTSAKESDSCAAAATNVPNQVEREGPKENTSEQVQDVDMSAGQCDKAEEREGPKENTSEQVKDVDMSAGQCDKAEEREGPKENTSEQVQDVDTSSGECDKAVPIESKNSTSSSVKDKPQDPRSPQGKEPGAELEEGELAKSVENSDEDYEEIEEWEDSDDYLLYLADVLKRIHTAFYEVYDQSKDKQDSIKPDIKNIIPYVRSKTLKGKNIVFSGVFPLKSKPEECRLYQIAKAMGGNIQTDIVLKKNSKAGEYTTHVIAARPGTSKVHLAQRHKYIRVVTPDWLATCAERWELVDERLYKLQADSSGNPGCDSPFSSQRKGKRARTPGKSQESRQTKAAKLDETDENKEEAKAVEERRFSDTFSPLAAFSSDEIADMDKEVEEIFDESDSNDSENDELRKKVLDSASRPSSSEDSLSGEFPKGWSRKRKRSNKASEENADDENDEEKQGEVSEDTSQDHPYRVFRHSSSSSSEEDNASEKSFDSIGSLDEEMAAALEKEFLS